MTDAASTDKDYKRLSDIILEAFQVALDQKDLDIADSLSRALEMAMTRNAGGTDFVERRQMSEEVERAIIQLAALRKEAQAAG